MNKKSELRQRRRARLQARIRGTQDRPRAAVYRTNSHISVQLINDDERKVICSYSDLSDKKVKGTKTERAAAVGKELAKLAKEKGVEKIAFDRAGYKYHGRVKALAEAMREGGLQF